MRTILSIVFVFLLFVWSDIMFAQDVFTQQRASWLLEAERSKPELHKEICYPVRLVNAINDRTVWQDWRMESVGDPDVCYQMSFKEKQQVLFDFGRHLTGYLTFCLTTLSRVQDAPIKLRFTCAEVPSEVSTPFDPYPGTLSRGWLQDEIITITEIDRDITLPRRFACRYVKVELLGASVDFDFALSKIYITAQTSVQVRPSSLPESTETKIKQIDLTALETLKECMQTVYEDGPKRDQRLWIGDLYLESLANTYTYKQLSLTRRCLYLLAGLSAEDGRLHANVFEHPIPHPQTGTFCMDYSLLYNLTLLDYVKATGDVQTAEDLFPVVEMQLHHALSYVSNGLFDQHLHEPRLWLFFDWCDGLVPDASIQGLLILTLNRSAELVRMIGRKAEANKWTQLARKMKIAARRAYYRPDIGLVISGDGQQISYLSQSWMILSGVLSPKEARRALENVMQSPSAVRPRTPYAWHYVIEAAITCNMHHEARKLLTDYWGGMLDRGADTFWEVYDPADSSLSPYHFAPVNSYCHAWSCTPAYFIRRYPDIFQQ